MGDGTRIEINTSGVREFGTRLQDYVDKDIAPTTGFVKLQLITFQAFGLYSASPVVQEAAKQYWRHMEQAMGFLDALTHNTGALARTAHEVATTYQDADLNSADFLLAVEAGSSAELTEGERAAADSASRAADADRQQRINEHRELHGGAA